MHELNTNQDLPLWVVILSTNESLIRAGFYEDVWYDHKNSIVCEAIPINNVQTTDIWLNEENVIYCTFKVK